METAWRREPRGGTIPTLGEGPYEYRQKTLLKYDSMARPPELRDAWGAIATDG
jgi:hypothetical protein